VAVQVEDGKVNINVLLGLTKNCCVLGNHLEKKKISVNMYLKYCHENVPFWLEIGGTVSE